MHFATSIGIKSSKLVFSAGTGETHRCISRDSFRASWSARDHLEHSQVREPSVPRDPALCLPSVLPPSNKFHQRRRLGNAPKLVLDCPCACQLTELASAASPGPLPRSWWPLPPERPGAEQTPQDPSASPEGLRNPEPLIQVRNLKDGMFSDRIQ